MSQRRASPDEVIAVLFQSIPEFEVHHEKSVLLLINFIDCAEFFVKMASGKGISVDDAREALNNFDREAKKAAANAGRLLKACRDRGYEIFHLRSEMGAGRKTRLVVPSSGEVLPTYEALVPRKGELVLTETSGDAFTETRLDYVLRNMNIDSLIICGLMTDQNVLLSTIKAVDLGYRVVLVEDACATFTADVHSVFVKWFRTFVNVKTTQEMLSSIK